MSDRLLFANDNVYNNNININNDITGALVPKL